MVQVRVPNDWAWENLQAGPTEARNPPAPTAACSRGASATTSMVSSQDNAVASSSSSDAIDLQGKGSSSSAVKRHVDILTYRHGELRELVQKVREAQKVAEQRLLPAAFVTFK